MVLARFILYSRLNIGYLIANRRDDTSNKNCRENVDYRIIRSHRRALTALITHRLY